ncbi:MAG: hypothetical protein ABSA52_09725 [Candidatus Binatia bacterium]|jgi:hypothetical protein
MTKATKGRLPNRIRRNLDQYGDPYLPKLGPGETSVCSRCHVIYQRRHWFFDEALFSVKS